MIRFVLLQKGFRSPPLQDSMEGVPPFVGWLLLLFFLYIIFRVWWKIQQEKKGRKY
jgi:hypothetical protein